MAKIVTVYTPGRHRFKSEDMSYIRWLKISEALANWGHQVDIATNEPLWWLRKSPIEMSQNLRRVPLAKVQWREYDVVKTLFHLGFETLERYGGIEHPFIISKLGSVVASRDMEGIYFYGKIREKLYSTQEKIHRVSKFVTLLSEPARELWIDSFGRKENLLIVPAGVDRDIPPALRNPYPDVPHTRVIFSGNVYSKNSQPEANRVLVDKLNTLGRLLSSYNARLYMSGPGDLRRLDERHGTHLGLVSYEKAWNYLQFADVGVVVSAGKFQHNNESSKIYYYLRAGLPVVSESGFPNDNVVTESKLGFVVENNDLELMARKISEAAQEKWDRDSAVQYILENHTWEKRAEVYNRLLKKKFN